MDYRQYVIDRLPKFLGVSEEARCSMKQDSDGDARVFIQMHDGRRQGSRAVKIEVIQMKGWVSTPNCDSAPISATLWLLETKTGKVVVRTEVLHNNELIVDEAILPSEFSTVALQTVADPKAFLYA